MVYLPLIALSIVAFVMLWQDLKNRAISWFLFPMLLFFMLLFDWEGWSPWLFSLAVNALFLLLQISLLLGWFLFKGLGPRTVLSSYIGKGDLLLFMVLCIGLPSILFIPFYVLSLLVSLVAGLTVFKKSSVPLAGLQAAMLPFALLFMGFLEDSINPWPFY